MRPGSANIRSPEVLQRFRRSYIEFDEVVRVPLVLRAPGLERAVARVPAQVRLMDVANTVVDWLQLDPMDESEGVLLLPYAEGEADHTVWCALVGQDLDGAWLIGMRNNGIKYVRRPDGAEALFALGDDPRETTSVHADQPAALEQARRLLASEADTVVTVRALFDRAQGAVAG